MSYRGGTSVVLVCSGTSLGCLIRLGEAKTQHLRPFIVFCSLEGALSCWGSLQPSGSAVSQTVLMRDNNQGYNFTLPFTGPHTDVKANKQGINIYIKPTTLSGNDISH